MYAIRSYYAANEWIISAPFADDQGNISDTRFRCQFNGDTTIDGRQYNELMIEGNDSLGYFADLLFRNNFV